MVGHTHEDIDQLFLCLSRSLSNNNAWTLSELIQELGNSHSSAIETKDHRIHVWHEAMAGGVCSAKSLGYIRQHQFKVVKVWAEDLSFFKRSGQQALLWHHQRELSFLKSVHKATQIL